MTFVCTDANCEKIHGPDGHIDPATIPWSDTARLDWLLANWGIKGSRGDQLTREAIDKLMGRPLAG